MKKSILLFGMIIILICSNISCSRNDDSDESIFEMESYEMIEYETGIYDNKNWNDPTGTYYGDVVPSKTVALNIAVSVFEGMEKSKTASQFTPQRVFYDEEEGIWIVTFWDSDAYENGIIGYDCTIAIDKRNGAVVRIWFGE